jgi:hypothetical protein
MTMGGTTPKAIVKGSSALGTRHQGLPLRAAVVYGPIGAATTAAIRLATVTATATGPKT